MSQDSSKQIREYLTFLSIILILGGALLIFIGHTFAADSLWRKFFESIGVVVSSVFTISLLYEKFLAEKHLKRFGENLKQQLRQLDSLASKAQSFGIEEIHRNRFEYQSKYSFKDLVGLAKPNSELLCVGRTLFHLYNQDKEFKSALQKGLKIRLACLSPESSFSNELNFTSPDDIRSGLGVLQGIVRWSIEAKPTGSLELRYHELHLPDSFLSIETEEGKKLIWDLSFGRDLQDKRVFMLHPAQKNFGYDIEQRYSNIWKLSTCKFKLEAGVVKKDDLNFSTVVPSRELVFSDDFSADTGWNNYLKGAVERSSDRSHGGKFSLKKYGNNDPHGGYKEIGQEIGLDVLFSGWIFRPSVLKKGKGIADRLAIENEGFSGYGFCIAHGSLQVWIERREEGKKPSIIGDSALHMMPKDDWYQFKFYIRSGGKLELYLLDSKGNQLFSTSASSNEEYDSFDRVVVHGGQDYYVDDLKIEKL